MLSSNEEFRQINLAPLSHFRLTNLRYLNISGGTFDIGTNDALNLLGLTMTGGTIITDGELRINDDGAVTEFSSDNGSILGGVGGISGSL